MILMFYWKDLVIRKRLLFVTLICALPLMVNGCISTEPSLCRKY